MAKDVQTPSPQHSHCPDRPCRSSQTRPPPAAALGSRFVPVVAHAGGRPLSSFHFVFHQPGWPNSLAPFRTAQKPSCGPHCPPGTIHGRQRLDVPSADPGQWRSFHGPRPGAAQNQQ
uniref:Uncharacterized protein n=1 Tax=Taeniopygia guttata TaxID=59729 RepID=A0A674GIS1_TAEGU